MSQTAMLLCFPLKIKFKSQDLSHRTELDRIMVENIVSSAGF